MKINGKISILIEREYTTIKVRDDDACITFLEIRMTPDQLSSALSRLANTDCQLELKGLEKIGKTHENDMFEFPMKYSDSKADLELACNEYLFEKGLYELVSDHGYKSQGTFFKKGNEKWVRVVIRRWI